MPPWPPGRSRGRGVRYPLATGILLLELLDLPTAARASVPNRKFEEASPGSPSSRSAGRVASRVGCGSSVESWLSFAVRRTSREARKDPTFHALSEEVLSRGGLAIERIYLMQYGAELRLDPDVRMDAGSLVAEVPSAFGEIEIESHRSLLLPPPSPSSATRSPTAPPAPRWIALPTGSS